VVEEAQRAHQARIGTSRSTPQRHAPQPA
jgi:hypothetical protein